MKFKVALFSFLVVGVAHGQSQDADVNSDPFRMTDYSKDRIDFVESVKKLSSLLPSELKRIGLNVSLPSLNVNSPHRGSYAVNGVPKFADPQDTRYQIAWGMETNNGAFLTLGYGRDNPCVSPGRISQDFGEGKVSREPASPHDRLGYGSAAHDYMLNDRMTLRFMFRGSCVSELQILQPMPPTWSPRLGELSEIPARP